MDPITLTLVSGGISIVSSLIGQAIASGDRAKAEEIRAKAAALYGDDKVNKIIEETKLGPSAWEGYKPDAEGLAAQKLALQKLQEGATTQGLTADEKFNLSQGMDEAANYEKGQRGAIMDNAYARGVGGSGMELAAQLQGQQGGAMRANVAARSAQADAARRKALATMQLGEFGGNVRQQGFNEFGAKATAQDSINKFNKATSRDLKQWATNGQAAALAGQAQGKDAAANGAAETFGGVGQGIAEIGGTAADLELKKKYGYGGY